ncbi:hypothetical protein [Chitinimonas sp.]|uniref:hypothetical protein n=1 Tax=Chitinimonas sp. TaxID=1934313 RepID=UPI0035B01801
MNQSAVPRRLWPIALLLSLTVIGLASADCLPSQDKAACNPPQTRAQTRTAEAVAPATTFDCAAARRQFSDLARRIREQGEPVSEQLREVNENLQKHCGKH